MQYLGLIGLGIIVGTFGTLVGAGGGFILVPILLLLYPQENPETITSISLAVVSFNALSGSVAYARRGRIDYYSGFIFSLAAFPGAILGALTTAYLPRYIFQTILGFLMVGVALWLYFNSVNERAFSAIQNNDEGDVRREVTERNGHLHSYSYKLSHGLGLSILVGYISSLLGIGGGIIHVPAMVEWLNFPIHLATATSHFILSIVAITGTLVHIGTGVFHHGLRRTVALSIGVLCGAQLGAYFSDRLKGRWILRALSFALGFVGLRILFIALNG